MDLLVLGGTSFIGPFQVEHALARGHRVTVLNRGRHSVTGVEQLRGDLGGDLSALSGRSFDAVLDNPTMRPAWVRNVAGRLAGRVGHYIFISTISVYPPDLAPESDESAPTQAPVDDGEMPTHYGALKRQCELEVARLHPDRHAIVRPGLIVGPRDPTDRFTYWPVRIAEGGEVLAPGAPSDRVQVVDVRDLAEWTVRLAEDPVRGVFNATGPAQPLSIGGLLEEVRAGTGADARFTWVEEAFLEAHGVQAWSHVPVWAGGSAGITQVRVDRALAAGLTFRPLATTARDTLQWDRARPEVERAARRAGMTREREAEVLALWKLTRSGSSS